MYWRLMHHLFGHDYIAWRGFRSGGVSRVRKSEDGVVYFMDDKNEPNPVLSYPTYYLQDGRGGATLYQVLFLTCAPQKYLTRCDFRTFH